jgi:translocation and assembly module TamB
LYTATVRLALRDGRVEVDGDARALGGALAMAGEARPFEPTPTFRITRARFDTVRVDSTFAGPLRAVLTGTLEGEASLPPDTFPTLHARLRIDEGRLNAQRLDSAVVEARTEGDQARLDATLSAAGGHADVRATATLVRDSGALALRAARADGTLAFPDLGGLLGRDSADAALDARFAVHGDGARPRVSRWDATLSATGRYDGARLDSLTLAARMEAGVLHLDTLVLASNFAHGEGGGTVALFDGAVIPDSVTRRGLDVRLDADSVAVIADLLGIHPLSLRRGGLEVHAARGSGGVEVTGSAGVGGVIGASFAADTVQADFTALLHDLELARADVDVRGEFVSLPSTVLDAVGGTVAYDTSGASFAMQATKDDGHEVRVAGLARVAERTVRFDSLDVDLPDRSWRLVRPATLAWGDRIDPDGITLASGTSRIAFEGALDRSGMQDLTVVLDSVPVRGFAELAGLEGLQGTFDGRLEVSGPAADVGLNGDLDASLGDATAHIAVRPAEGRALGVEVSMTDPRGDPLSVRGTIPFSLSIAAGGGIGPPPDQTMGLDITARAFSMDWITPFLRPLGVQTFAAELTADARLEGTMDDPSLTGSASLAQGRLEIPEQGISYADIHGDLRFPGDRIQVLSLTATAGGTAEIEGDVVLAPLNRPTFDLRGHFRGFEVVENAWTRLRVNGDVTLSGDLHQPVVGGSAQIENTDIYADQVGEGQMVRPVELTTEDYRMLASYFGYRPSEAIAVQRDPLLPWSIDLSLDIGNDVWVRRRTQPEMRIQIDGSLDVRKEPGESIRLFGTVEAVTGRSYFQQFGRRFTIANGTVTFNGSPLDWQVDAEARYEVPSARDPNTSEATITLDVRGRADDLGLTLGSEPSMENADILSYLATGRPAASAAEFGNAGSSGGSGGVLGAGEELALGRVAGLLEETAEEAVGLDVVEIRQNGLRGATLVAGRYVNPRLFVGFQQPLTLNARTEEATRDQSSRGTEVEIEYTWYRWLLVNIQGGQSTIRLFFRTKYAY